jgi:acyl-CoA synthetase (AMP-forming)/AMP-acid ligase II
MLDLSQYNSLGAALREALERWPDEICLIEADRERENCRLTYRQFKEAALPLAKWLQENGFKPGGRAAIIMTNQSKWLISAYAVFFCGGVLVPPDYKLESDHPGGRLCGLQCADHPCHRGASEDGACRRAPLGGMQRLR